MGSWFKGIKGKLLLLCAIPLAFLLIIGVMSEVTVRDLGEGIEKTGMVRMPLTALSGDMTIEINAVPRFLWTAYAFRNDAGEKRGAMQKLNKSLEDFEKSRLEYTKLPRSEKAKEVFKKVEQAYAEVVPLIKTAERMLESGSFSESEFKDLAVHEIRPRLTIMEDSIEEIDQMRMAMVKEDFDTDMAQVKRATVLNVGGLLFAMALTLGFSIVLARKLSGALSGITEKVADSATQVSAASTQLSGASQQLSAGATEAASSLEETSASLEEMTSMVKLNADHAKEASALSSKSRDSAEKGEEEIRQLITAMAEIAQSSKKIEEIINVIDDIAFQTNLLALNAAVEAARAGEQGRGFAVVAEAVRALAARSATAAKDITSLIKDSVSRVEHGAKIADTSGAVLKDIVTSVKKVADLNNEIATASNEQSGGIQQISQAVTNLDQATQGNAASAEEAAASSEEMSAQATVLQDLIKDLTVLVHGSNEATSGKSQHANTHATTHTAPTAAKPKSGAPRLVKVGEHAPAKHNQEAADPNKVIPFDAAPAKPVGTKDDQVAVANLKGF